MRIENVSQETQNKLFRLTKLQRTIHWFHDSQEKAVRIVLEPGEYASVQSAQNAYHVAIKRAGLIKTMNARTMDGNLYLIKRM